MKRREKATNIGSNFINNSPKSHNLTLAVKLDGGFWENSPSSCVACDPSLIMLILWQEHNNRTFEGLERSRLLFEWMAVWSGQSFFLFRGVFRLLYFQMIFCILFFSSSSTLPVYKGSFFNKILIKKKKNQ